VARLDALEAVTLYENARIDAEHHGFEASASDLHNDGGQPTRRRRSLPF
jgi:hypothetical protein